MQKLFVTLLDIIFPPSDDALRVRKLHNIDVRVFFSEKNADGTLSLTNFKNPDIRALIHEAKFFNNTRALQLLAQIFDIYFLQHAHTYDVIIPIPLSTKRLRTRGYNQVYEILCHTKAHPLIEKNSHILKRTKHTQPQTELTRDERIKNMVGVFSTTTPHLVTGKRILLVDDVTTTGATLRAAKAELLRHSPASVTCLALAH